MLYPMFTILSPRMRHQPLPERKIVAERRRQILGVLIYAAPAHASSMPRCFADSRRGSADTADEALRRLLLRHEGNSARQQARDAQRAYDVGSSLFADAS